MSDWISPEDVALLVENVRRKRPQFPTAPDELLEMVDMLSEDGFTTGSTAGLRRDLRQMFLARAASLRSEAQRA